VQEPEYTHVIFYLDPAGVLIPLERQKTSLEVKTKFGGLGGMQTQMSYKGSRSPVRFRAGQAIQFVVRVPPPVATLPGMEPPPQDDPVKLNVLKVSKDQRLNVSAKLGGGALMTGVGSLKTVETLRTLKFSKYGEQSTQVSPAEPLEPGEYVMTTALGGMMGMGNGDFLFGIDPK
jgi:hypothetical protein